MAIVKMPDGTLVDLPDNPTPQEAKEIAALMNGQETAGLLSRAGSAAVSGGKSLARGFGNAALTMLEGGFATGQLDPETLEPVRSPLFTKAEELLNRHLPKPAEPSFANAALEGAGGAFAGPTGAIGPIRTAVSGALAGGGGEGAARLFGDNALSRGLGAVLGGGLGAIGAHARTNAPTLAREGLEDVKPVHLDQAVERMRWAQSQGVPINLSQAMPRASNVDDLVDALANSRFGDKTISQLRDQPERLHIRSKIEAGKLPGVQSSPQDVANRAQEAATGAIKSGEAQASAAYRAALPAGTKVPVSNIQAFEDSLKSFAKANPNTAGADMANHVVSKLKIESGAPAQKVPLGSGKFSSRIQKVGAPTPPTYIDDAQQLKGAVDDAIQGFGANTLGTAASAKDLNRYAAQIRDLWKQTVRQPGTPLDNAAGAARQVFTDTVNPMKKSITGDIAGPRGASETRQATASKLESYFNKGTPQKGPSPILTLEKDLRNVDPTVFTDAVKTHIAGRLNKISPVEGERVAQDFAAQVKKTLAANPDQERGLRDMLAGVARSQGLPEKELVDGFMNFIRLSTTAARLPGRVSGLPVRDAIERAGESGVATALQAGPFGSFYQMGRRIRMALSADAFRTIDKLITTPEGVRTLQELAKSPIMSLQSQNAIAAFYGSLGQSDPIMPE